MGDFLTRELLAGALEEVLDADALLLGDAGGQAESLDAAAHADAENHFGCEGWPDLDAGLPGTKNLDSQIRA